MKKIKFRFLYAALLATPLLTMAETQDLMVLSLDDGTETPMEMVGVKKLTFGETQVSVVAKENYAFNTSVDYAKVKKISFKLGNAGVESIGCDDQAQLMITPNPATSFVDIKGYNGDEPANVTIWSMSGQLCRSIENWDGTSIDVSSMPKGFYLLRINGNTLKFIKL